MKGTKKTLRFLGFYLLLAVGILLSGAGVSFAQEGLGVALSPTNFELTANPGDLLVNKIMVLNPTEAVISVKMVIEDIAAVGETGEVIVEPPETETYSLAKWTTAEPLEFTLEPKQQKYVDFYIQVPPNAEPGGHYGSVLAMITAAVGEGMTGAATAQKVGALLLLTVSGKVKESLRVKEFSAPSFSEYGPVNFNIRFQNEGSVHVRPKGFVTITSWRGKVADLEFPQQNVIPGAIRRIETKWDKKWIIGRYTATLVGSYGSTNTPLQPVTIIFWVFPWRVAVVVCVAALLLLIFFIKSRRRWLMALRILIKGQ